MKDLPGVGSLSSPSCPQAAVSVHCLDHWSFQVEAGGFRGVSAVTISPVPSDFQLQGSVGGGIFLPVIPGEDVTALTRPCVAFPSHLVPCT